MFRYFQEEVIAWTVITAGPEDCCILLIIFNLLFSSNPQSPLSYAMHGYWSCIVQLKCQKMGEEDASSYILTSHPESPEKSRTRPGWTQRTQCVHPTVTKGRETDREGVGEWPRDKSILASYFKLAVLSWTPCCSFMMSLLYSAQKPGQTFAPSQLLFLPCTWLSPEAEICHLWSLGRWMLLPPSLKVTTHKHTGTEYLWRRCFTFFPVISHHEWTWWLNLSDKIENILLWLASSKVS